MTLLSGERQVAPVLSGIRRDHTARYEWAARFLKPGSRVADFGCGIGYGANILANAGHSVVGIERDDETRTYARDHYGHERIHYRAGLSAHDGPFDAAVCFEAIEHIEDPLPVLKALAKVAPVLIASVPNESEFPFRSAQNNFQGYAFHYRHYTAGEFGALLNEAGYEVASWHGQKGPVADVEPGARGRTIIAVASRREASGEVMFEDRPDTSEMDCEVRHEAPIPQPEQSVGHVAIVGLGESCETYLDVTKRMGGRRAIFDQVWGINALGDVLNCDIVFHMDDMRIQEARAKAAPNGNITAMVKWLKTYTGRVMTSRKVEGYPGLEEFPLQDVLNDTGYAYFNNTAAYAVAYAIHKKAKRISIFGCDYTYQNRHDAEKGRGCMEFWLGIAADRGIAISIAKDSSLMDMNVPKPEKLYGYDCVDVTSERGADGKFTLGFLPRETIPTADEIESRYDHSK